MSGAGQSVPNREVRVASRLSLNFRHDVEAPRTSKSAMKRHSSQAVPVAIESDQTNISQHLVELFLHLRRRRNQGTAMFIRLKHAQALKHVLYRNGAAF